MQKHFQGVVLHGDKTGRALGFPTVNFDPSLLESTRKEGVYASTVRVDNRSYRGALYLGPRITLGETKRVLEVHLLDFSGDLYEKTLIFTIETFIRPPRDFQSVEALKAQLAEDVLAVRRASI